MTSMQAIIFWINPKGTDNKMPNWKNKIIANSRASTQQSKHLTAGEAS